MRIRSEDITTHLQKRLLPLYVISGDEPLLTSEAAEAVRSAARNAGFSERQVLHVEAGFDWAALGAAADSLSLFAERRLIELRMPSGKPGDAGAKALSAYAERPSEDNLLLVITGKLDTRQQQSKWFKALDAAGAVVQAWPVAAKALPEWVARRMRERGMQPSAEAARLIAERVEGNLLAAAQEVEKLRLLCSEGPVDAEQVREAVADSSRYDVFELADTAMAGDAGRAARIVYGLKGEGVEPPLVLWALAREIRVLASMAGEMERGASAEGVLGAHKVWPKRRAVVGTALRRHNAARWQALLVRAARIDRMIKGMAVGNPWDELVQLALLVAGRRVL